MRRTRLAWLVFLTTSVALPMVAAAGPVMVYHMDETAGPIVDSTPGGNTGTFNGAAASDYALPGRFGTALGFRGGQEIDSGTGIAIDDRSFTIETWIKPDAIRGSEELIASKPDGGNLQNLHLRLGGPGGSWPAPGGLLFGFYAGDLPSSGGVVADNRWQHVAFVFKKNASAPHERYIYVNGVQVASDTPSYVYQGAGGHFFVGSWDTSQFLHGQLDEFRVYDEALDAATVARHADGLYGEYAPRVPLLVMRMNDTANPIVDATGIYSGTYNGTGFRYEGKVDGALLFDGDDYVQVPSDGVLDFDNRSFTIEMWAKQLDGTGEQCVASKPDEGGTNKNMHLRIYENGAIRFDWYANSANAPAGTFTLGDWHHLAFTYDYNPAGGNGTRRIFYDGQIVAEQLGVTPYLGTGGAFYIGSWGGMQFFRGLLDEVRVYNYALDPQTVLDHYHLQYAEFPIPEPTSLVLLGLGTVLMTARFRRF